jgi:hypothetical protein
MKWYSTKAISDFEKKPEESKIYNIKFNLESSDVFHETNYSFCLNPPTLSEFGNIFNDKYMNHF